MRKRFVGSVQQEAAHPGQIPADAWIDVGSIAEIEITSEAAAHPIEGALLSDGTSGWRAAMPGRQMIRLSFAQPLHLGRIWLSFVEPLVERTQEYRLRWSPDGGQSFREIVRQQWNFSPHTAESETEDHHVDLVDVSVLELEITPDIRAGSALASLEKLRLA